MNYFIREDYVPNLTEQHQVVEQYSDVPKNTKYQVAAYKFAARFMQKHNYESAIELGSGAGYKLNKFILPVAKRVVGIDMPHSVKHCTPLYPDITWLHDDFDNPVTALNEKFDVTLSFDVVEHLVYPEKLLDKLKAYCKEGGHIIISTPERDLVRGKEHKGPSPNKLHVREWNKEEFRKFLESQGLKVLEHHILPAQDLTLADRFYYLRNSLKNNTCQLAVCFF
jgi:2-polyprenyl-3-methyl-5-hydroxy-6-metoxy-1,4-benzoquinol methylase